MYFPWLSSPTAVYARNPAGLFLHFRSQIGGLISPAPSQDRVLSKCSEKG